MIFQKKNAQNRLLLKTIFLSIMVVFFCIPLTAQGAGKKIAFIGSSSFDALCHTYHYDAELAKLINGSTVNCFAKSGDHVSDFVAQYEKNVKGKGYTDLVIYAGLNGLTSDVGVKTAQQNLMKIFTQAESEGTRVVVVSAQPYQAQAEYLKKNHAWIATKPGGVDLFINLYSTLDKNGDDIMDDQYGGNVLHTNSTGYKLIFQAITQEGFGISQGIVLNNPGTTGASGIPASVDLVEKKLSNEEIARLVSKPLPKIKIPGLNFTDFTVDDIQEREDGSVYISMPFIGEYLAAVFKYLIVIAGIVATARLIMAGFLWALPGTSKDDAKKIIINSVIGLGLAVGGYTILYTINPNLVSFAEISIPFIPEQEIHFTSIDPTTFQNITGSTPLGKEETIALAQKLGADIGLPKCVMDTIMAMESGGKTAIIGHDENFRSNKKPVGSRKNFLISGTKFSGEKFTPIDAATFDYKKHNSSEIINDDDLFINSPPDYGLDWRFTHGLGAGQITLSGDDYCDGARGIIQSGTCYNIPELLDSKTNVQVTVNHVKGDLECATKLGLTGDDLIKGTFASYNAGCGGFTNKFTKSIDEVRNFSYVKKAFPIYQKCLNAI